MKKMLVGAIILVIMATGMVFAGGQQDNSDGYTIGYSQHWGTITYARVVMLGAVDAAAEWSEKLGVEVKVKGTDSGMDDPSIQANDIQDLYAQGVDGLMLFSGDAKIVGQAVKNTFNKDGAPVVVTDTGMIGADFICHVTTDNYSAGKIGAEALKGAIPAKAKVIAFNGAPGIESVNNRVQGYEETCVALGYELLPTKTCKVSVEEGKQLMEDMLVSEPDLAAVFTTNIDTAIGASSALKNAGNTTCHIIAFDLNDVAYKMVKDGEIYALVIQDPYFMGHEGLNQVMYSLTGETSKIKKNIGAPAHVMTSANAADYADNPALTLK